MPPMNLGRKTGYFAASIAQMRLCLQRGNARFLGRPILRVSREPNQRTAWFEHSNDVGERMLDALKRTDNTIELNPLLGIEESFVEHGLCCSQRVRSEHDAACVEHVKPPKSFGTMMPMMPCSTRPTIVHHRSLNRSPRSCAICPLAASRQESRARIP